MKIKSLFSIFAFLHLAFLNESISQDVQNYLKYDFEKFANIKADGYEILMGDLYKEIKYPNNARENKIEDKVKVLIIHHAEIGIEIFTNSKYLILNSNTKTAVENIIKSRIKEIDNENYLTELWVNYDLEPWEDVEEQFNHIYVKAYKSHIRH